MTGKLIFDRESMPVLTGPCVNAANGPTSTEVDGGPATGGLGTNHNVRDAGARDE